MAGSPVGSASPQDLESSSDQDESMDTDSEADDQTKPENQANGFHDPEVDSSVNMEMSDNEDTSDEPDRGNSLPAKALSFANGVTSLVKPSAALLTSPDRSGQENTDHAARTFRGQSQIMSNQAVALENILDLKQSLYGLNVAIWQRILSFVPPLSLGRLLQTSRIFHALLEPTDLNELALQKRFSKDARFLSPDSIWQTSRIGLTCSVPKPLQTKSELYMWRMIYGRKCQVCHQLKPFINPQEIMDPWHAGPGNNGLRLLWICAALICGNCLAQQCQQEVSLQFSNAFPSFLIKALPPLFLTQNNDWIPQSTLLSQPPPPHLQIQKFYYQLHIDQVLRKFEGVKEFGEAAAGEWLKGLEAQCREHLTDANRWEQWELNGGLRRIVDKHSQKPLAQAPLLLTHQSPPINPALNGIAVPSNPPYVDPSIPTYHPQGPPPMHMMPPNTPMPFHGYPPPPSYGNFQPYPSPINPQVAQGKPRRSLQEVNEARAARRQEIERRCLLLDPPLTAKVLSHMQSFQAALQISFPFTDKDWEVLKPRLLAQREAAESQEAVLAEQLKAIQATVVQPPLEVLLMKNPHELSENEWEQLQTPVRDALAKHAEQRINDSWDGGSRVNHETVTIFAPDVLLTARNRYYDVLNEANSTNGAPMPRIPLSLESVKWLYDNKVKNIAEAYQKELFQCSVCDSNSKFYGFEGVIQHFAAKHTTALSLGNIIVNWRTEWPEIPPFNAAPGSAASGQNVAFLGNVRSTSDVNPGEYGQMFQSAPYSQQVGSGGVSQHPLGLGQFPQAATFYGQSDDKNYNATPSGYPNGSQIFPQHPTYGVVEQGFQSSQMPYMPSSATSELHRKQLTEMAAYSRDLWNATMGIKELPASVRVYVLVHHVSIKFVKKFSTSPDVAMFLHGLNENAQMRPIRSLNGLSCKICRQSGQNSVFERKSFTLPALVNHFKNAHLGHAYSSSDATELDWRIDMVELPETEVIENLVDSNGMDERKFNLIAEAFSDIFPSPLPSLSAFKEARAKAKSAAIRLENLRALNFPLASSTSHQQQLAVSDLPTKTDSRHNSQDRIPSRSPYQSDRGSIEPPRDDEYDPSRNTFIGDIVEHSGLRRSANFQRPPDVVLPPGIVSLGVVDDHGQPESPYSQGGYADRLLRHHRGPSRRPTDPRANNGDGRDVQEYIKQSRPTTKDLPDASPSNRLHSDVAPVAPPHDSHVLYSNSAYSPLESFDARMSDHVLPISLRGAHYAYSPPQYAEIQPEYGNTMADLDSRSGAQVYHYDKSLSSSDRWRDVPPGQSAHIQGQAYPSRDRSRSPRRSLPREQLVYDPQMPQLPYEARDVRWRGDSPQRNDYHRGQQENIQVTRPGNSFIGRDAQGRNVRYVAVPADEYESQFTRYPSARAQVAEAVSYVTRSNEMMEVGPDGRLYVVNGRVPVRYERNLMDETYRDYR